MQGKADANVKLCSGYSLPPVKPAAGFLLTPAGPCLELYRLSAPDFCGLWNSAWKRGHRGEQWVSSPSVAWALKWPVLTSEQLWGEKQSPLTEEGGGSSGCLCVVMASSVFSYFVLCLLGFFFSCRKQTAGLAIIFTEYAGKYCNLFSQDSGCACVFLKSGLL